MSAEKESGMSEGKAPSAWHPANTTYEMVAVIPESGFEREEGSRLTLKP